MITGCYRASLSGGRMWLSIRIWPRPLITLATIGHGIHRSGRSGATHNAGAPREADTGPGRHRPDELCGHRLGAASSLLTPQTRRARFGSAKSGGYQLLPRGLPPVITAARRGNTDSACGAASLPAQHRWIETQNGPLMMMRRWILVPAPTRAAECMVRLLSQTSRSPTCQLCR